MFGLSPMEIGIILLAALLLFGRRLPEVGKHLGKGIVEFKKGLKGVGDEIDAETARTERRDAERRDAERREAARFADERPASPYRAPLNDAGEDVRVSRADHVDVPVKPQP